jgi:hypothetical protein
MIWSWHQCCDACPALHHAACLTRSAGVSVMRWTRPFSPGSDTRLRPSFLRTTPARKPRTECCCHSVAFIIAAIVAPPGARKSVSTLACFEFVRERWVDFDEVRHAPRDAGVAVARERGDTARGADLAGRRERVPVRFDFDLLMGSSVVLRDAIRRTTSSPDSDHLAAGLIPSQRAGPSVHSNARFPPECQSIRSNKIAHRAKFGGLHRPYARI